MKLKSFKKEDWIIRKKSLFSGDIILTSAYTSKLVQLIEYTKYHSAVRLVTGQTTILLNEDWDDGNWIRYELGVNIEELKK